MESSFLNAPSDRHLLQTLRPPPPPVSQLLDDFERRFRVLPVSEAEHQRHHRHAPDPCAREHNVRGGAPPAVADQERYADVHVDEVGDPAGQEGQGHGHHTAGVPQVQPVLLLRGLISPFHRTMEAANVPELLSRDQQNAAGHGSDGENGGQNQPVHLQKYKSVGKDSPVGAAHGCVCGAVGRRCGLSAVFATVVPIPTCPVVPAKGRQGRVEKRGQPRRQQRQRKAAVHPQAVVMQWVNDADVALIVHHHQVQKERQEQEVGENVSHHAGTEA